MALNMVFKSRKIKLGSLEIIPVWSDSMGAKSFSVFINTGDLKIIIDPGASIMQSSFPLSDEEKFSYLERANRFLSRFIGKSDLIIITHYHYDHFYHRDLSVYRGKILLAKDPNRYINESQRDRALEFFSSLAIALMKRGLDLLDRKESFRVTDPLSELTIASTRDFGDYNSRRKELLEKGKRWFFSLVQKWSNWKKIPEVEHEDIMVKFIDNKSLRFGDTVIRFYKPLFHGIEFSRLGWVVPVIIEKEGIKILYTSDINGPIIEDYAEWIIREDPDVLFLDGPATYMIPYMMNMINFRRAKSNLINIVTRVKSKYIFLDHHVTRDLRYRARLKEVFSKRKQVLSFAEFHGMKAIAQKLYEERYSKR